MEVRCHFCDEPHFIDDAEIEGDAFHFRCGMCETLHLVSDGAVRRVTLPEVRTSQWPDAAETPEPDYRDTLPDIALEDTFAPVHDDDPGDREPTLRMAPLTRARPLFGRETLMGATVLALGLGMVGYAAAGAPPRPLRALASGAVFHAIDVATLEARAPASATVAPAEPTVSPEATSRPRHRAAPPRKHGRTR